MTKYLKIATLIVISSLCILVCVILFTRPTFHPWLDLSGSGQIGDAIGGIATPIVGILAAVLVFLSFQEQLAANRIQRKALEDEMKRSNSTKDIDILLRLYEQISNDISGFVLGKSRYGTNGISDYSVWFENAASSGKVNLEIEKAKTYFNQIAAKFDVVSAKLEKATLLKEDENLALQLFVNLFIQNLSTPLNRIIGAHEDFGGTENFAPSPQVYIDLKNRMQRLLESAYNKGIVVNERK